MTVALPVYRDAGTLREAAGDMLAQTGVELELLLVLNGADEATRGVAAELGAADGRVRVIELAEAGLARALNVALREARGEWVARMDADDRCPPDRVARQLAELRERRGLSAVGCAWEALGADGVARVIRPATDPRVARWRLRLGNEFAHGSMVVKRERVLAVGGYDERRARAQDYDLWMRLAQQAEIAAVPEVLYTHRLKDKSEGAFAAGRLQAQHSAEVMIAAWQGLGAAGEDERKRLAALMARGLAGEDIASAIEGMLTERVSAEGLLAYLWWERQRPGQAMRAREIGRRARIREVIAELRRAGVAQVWIWGAGAHTTMLAPLLEHAGVRVAGVVDDAREGEIVMGRKVQRPEALAARAEVVLSSDAFEDRLWERSEEARARGVRVWRLYGPQGD